MVSVKSVYRETLESKLLAAWDTSCSIKTAALQDERRKRADDLFQMLEAHRIAFIQSGDLKWIAFTGFGHKLLRDAFCLIIRHYVKPRLFHSAMTDDSRWEGLMCVRLRRDEDMALLCEHFAASITLVDIDTFMGPSMMACLERIQRGCNFMGNYFTKKCAYFRSQYASAKEAQRLQAKREEEQQVRVLTGIEFTPRNMISLYQEYNSTMQYWRQQNSTNLRESRDHLDWVYRELNLQTERLRLLARDLRDHGTVHAADSIGAQPQPWSTWSAYNLNSVAQSRLTSIINGFDDIHSSRSRFFASENHWARDMPLA